MRIHTAMQGSVRQAVSPKLSPMYSLTYSRPISAQVNPEPGSLYLPVSLEGLSSTSSSVYSDTLTLNSTSSYSTFDVQHLPIT